MPELFKFQKTAVQQLLNHEALTADTSCLIGDDMGLGKTVEAIVLDNGRRRWRKSSHTAQTLVVTVKSAMGGWKAHYAEWAPWYRVKVIDVKNRHDFIKALHQKDANGNPYWHVFVCHWQVLRYIGDDLQKVQWFHIIGDEVQNIKNRKAQQTQAFKKLRTLYKTGLSGTWADNKPDDAWSVLNWLWPRTWSSYWAFFNYHVIVKQHAEGFCPECEKSHKRPYRETIGIHDPGLIWRTMGNAYVRRTKDQVWEDLPDKTYTDVKVELLAQQRRTYDEMAKDMLAWVGKNEDQPLPVPNAISKLVRLQQFAVAYGQIETVMKGGVPYQVLRLTEPSSKLDAAMELIEETNGQVVVFGQSKQAINLLAARLQAAGISTGVLTGDTKQADRDLAIQEFQSGRLRVFASTIKAGGVAITLTASSTCIFLDRDWSPSKNRQAEDRLHRLGQKNACTYYILVARDTIDRERNEKIELKWEWLKAILDPKKETV